MKRKEVSTMKYLYTPNYSLNEDEELEKFVAYSREAAMKKLHEDQEYFTADFYEWVDDDISASLLISDYCYYGDIDGLIEELKERFLEERFFVYFSEIEVVE